MVHREDPILRTWPALIAAVLSLVFSSAMADQTLFPPILPSGTSAPELSFGSQQILSDLWPGDDMEKDIQGSDFGRPTSPSVHRGESPNAPMHTLPPLAPDLRGSIRSVSPPEGRRAVALTFDLCETSGAMAGYDADVVNYLRSRKIKATFFAGGKWMRSHPERTLQLMADPLFEVGNHSWTHANFRLLSPRESQEQILRTQAQYETLREELRARTAARRIQSSEMERIPAAPLLFRFPFGTCNAQSLEMLAGYGLAAIQWDVVTGDPARNQTAAAIARVVLQQVRPGSIIIAHANRRGHGTAESLDLFIPKLMVQGYEFVTVSELLTLGKPVAANDCYELTPGDNLHYDKLEQRSRK